MQLPDNIHFRAQQAIISAYHAKIGKVGGSKTSAAKTASGRINTAKASLALAEARRLRKLASTNNASAGESAEAYRRRLRKLADGRL